MTVKFAEHFHDSWAMRKLEKGWVHGELYSRQNLTHPRLLPFALLHDYEKEFYKERCAECLRTLNAWNYIFEMVDHDANERANQNRISSGTSIQDFNSTARGFVPTNEFGKGNDSNRRENGRKFPHYLGQKNC